MNNSEKRNRILDAPFNENSDDFRLRYKGVLDNQPKDKRNVQETAGALHSIAQSYLMEGKIEDAEKYFQRAIELYESPENIDKMSWATCLSQYADVLKYKPDYPKSEALFLKAIEIGKIDMQMSDPIFKLLFLDPYFDLLEKLGRNVEIEALKEEIKQK